MSKYEENEDIIRENVSRNLIIIQKEMNCTQRKLADAMDTAPSMVTAFIRRERTPSLSAVLNLTYNKDIQSRIPFTADQFLNGNIHDTNIVFGNDFVFNQDDSSHEVLLGTYYLYFFDQNMDPETNPISHMRKLRYGVLGLYEMARKSGGVSVLALARFFKSIDEVVSFKNDFSSICASDEERQKKEVDLFKGSSEAYSGAVSLIGNHVFIDLLSDYYHDKGLLCLSVPEKKPDSKYIGGLGNIVSITHGSEHIPVSQKIIVSRGLINASNEEISSHLLYGNASIDLDGETQVLLNLLDTLYSSNGDDYIDKFLDKADKRAIITNRMRQLVNNYISRTFNGLCIVSRKDDHECYQFLKRYAEQ